jgi:2-amino-4-hydroxy-6-hydroxymethyldihydropteridine diphosphokinase
VHKLILHLGSNVGRRRRNLEVATHLIDIKIGKIELRSSYYITEAWGVKEQADFINLALIVHTTLPVEKVLDITQQIESLLGRKRTIRWGERIIDIDILFYDDQIIKKANLIIPHPQITNRNFVLVPLNEICPEFIHPELNQTINKLLLRCKDNSRVALLK